MVRSYISATSSDERQSTDGVQVIVCTSVNASQQCTQSSHHSTHTFYNTSHYKNLANINNNGNNNNNNIDLHFYPAIKSSLQRWKRSESIKEMFEEFISKHSPTPTQNVDTVHSAQRPQTSEHNRKWMFACTTACVTEITTEINSVLYDGRIRKDGGAKFYCNSSATCGNCFCCKTSILFVVYRLSWTQRCSGVGTRRYWPINNWPTTHVKADPVPIKSYHTNTNLLGNNLFR